MDINQVLFIKKKFPNLGKAWEILKHIINELFYQIS